MTVTAVQPGTVRVPDLPRLPTYIGTCCREWVLAAAVPGRCGICNQVPTYTRPDDHPANPLNPPEESAHMKSAHMTEPATVACVTDPFDRRDADYDALRDDLLARLKTEVTDAGWDLADVSVNLAITDAPDAGPNMAVLRMEGYKALPDATQEPTP